MPNGSFIRCQEVCKDFSELWLIVGKRELVHRVSQLLLYLSELLGNCLAATGNQSTDNAENSDNREQGGMLVVSGSGV